MEQQDLQDGARLFRALQVKSRTFNYILDLTFNIKSSHYLQVCNLLKKVITIPKKCF